MSLIDTIFPDGAPADLTAYGLVMPQAVRDTLMQKQDDAGLALHRVEPVALTDGRWALSADVLSEARPDGLFSRVDLIDAGNLAQVSVLPWSKVVVLLPEVANDLI